MTDIEELVRATLTDARRRLDPPAGHYQRIDEKIAKARRRRGLRAAGAVCVVVGLLVGGGLLVDALGPSPATRPAARPSSSATTPSPYGQVVRQETVGRGAPQDVVGVGGSLYVVESAPDTLLRLDPATLAVTGTATVPGAPRGVTADPVADRLWVWYQTTTGMSRAGEYELAGLTPLRDLPVAAGTIFRATAMDGQLWLGTDNGLYRIGTSDTSARPLAGFGQQVFGLVADPGRHRVLVDEMTSAGVRPAAVDPVTLAVTPGGVLHLGKEEIVVVAGQIWVGGYESGDDPRLVRLDPATLQPLATSPVGAQLGPGAILWAGASVLWVRNGGDEGLSCLDPSTGAILQQWRSVQGPVASVPGAAVAVDGSFMVRPVLAGACHG